MDRISIVIPIFNRLKVTKRGLFSLNAALQYYGNVGGGSISLEVVVVDDGSSDGSSDWIQSNFPSIKLVNGSGDLWWTGSVNLGCKYAVENLKSDYVLLWNDDTVADNNFFVELERILQSDVLYRQNILVSKILWFGSNQLFNFGCLFNPATGKKVLIGSSQEDTEDFQRIKAVDWSGGMGTLIPAKVLCNANFFDSANFPQYHGDADFFLRAKRIGVMVFAIPSLRIYNNRETSGIKVAKKLADFPELFFSNRSNYNISQNIRFHRRHSSSVLCWIYLLRTYIKIFLLSFRSMLWR